MCGIFGFWAQSRHVNISDDQLARVGGTLDHRGPDGAGVWRDYNEGLGLVHRRLAILDLSPSGHQPMTSWSGRYVITFNGEIYNFKELRQDLESLGAFFRGHSDTEVLLAAVDAWGLEKTLLRANGMFAFALWDRDCRTLYLVRDRLGEKPIYYGTQGGVLLFGSELKALHAWPDFRAQIDIEALGLYFRLGYVPSPWSIFSGIAKLPAGSYLKVTDGEVGNPKQYWTTYNCIAAGKADPFEGNVSEALDALDVLLRDSVSMRMVADVPLGAFLSGGIDSSLIVSMMQAQSTRPVRTFTVGFSESGFNEAEHAKAVAKQLGTDHTEVYLDPNAALLTIPRIPELFDEPFGDESQIPSYLVAQVAKHYVTVALSGDGGDELFGGYNRYFVGREIWKKIRSFPHVIRRVGEYLGYGLTGGCGSLLLNTIQSITGQRCTLEQLNKIVRLVGSVDEDEMYWRLISFWDPPPLINTLKFYGEVAERKFRTSLRHESLNDFTESMMAADLLSYLPNDILVKFDRSAMGVGLEGRIPLLDHRVVEFGWRLPLHYKMRDGKGKWLMRQLLYKYVPAELVDRPKMGFSVPLATWLREPLREWAEELLNENRLRKQGLLDVNFVRREWDIHLNGGRSRAHELWHVLMFQAWHMRWMERN